MKKSQNKSNENKKFTGKKPVKGNFSKSTEKPRVQVFTKKFDTFEEAIKRQEIGQYRDKVQQYISRLSNQQVNILNLLIDGYKPNEIQMMLEISSTEYAEDLKIMRSFENVKILF